MGTARELLYDTVYGDDAIKYQGYTQLVKQIRGYPNYYKLTDELSYVDGPDVFGGNYQPQDELWLAEVYDNKVAVQKESNSSQALVYEHTDKVENVSLEFDQSGRVMFTFESEGKVYLRWYDPVPQTTVTFEVGEGIAPKLTTDNYRRSGPVSLTERLLFYIREGNLYGRRQDDRYRIEYLVRDLSGEGIDILSAKPTMYGNINITTVVNGPQVLTVASEGFVLYPVDAPTAIDVDSGLITLVDLINKVKRAIEEDSTSIYLDSGLISLVELQDKVIKTFSEDPAVSIQLDTGTILSVSLEDKVIKLLKDDPSISIYLDTGAISKTDTADVRVFVLAEQHSASISLDSGTISGVSLEQQS